MRATAVALSLILLAAFAAAGKLVATVEPMIAAAWQTTKAASLEAAVETGAPLLEERIVTWRQQALDDGTQPMPRAIREQLAGYFPVMLLDRVRYRIGWSERRTLQSGLFRLIDARAVALIDVIVFRDGALAGDPVIWAHELAHVQQYDEWGTLQFARRYLRDPRAIESDAWEVAARYTMWALQEGRLPASIPPAARL
jgi:Domain of unknown function (DUF4157)